MWTEGTHVGSVEDVATANSVHFCARIVSIFTKGLSRDVREAVDHIIQICVGTVFAIRAWSPRGAI